MQTASPVRFTRDDLPDLTDRTVVVTGASSGLGELLTGSFARAGAHVVMAVRNRAKGDAVRQAVRATSPRGELELADLDVADLDSVRRFADAMTGRRIDLLMNNAGVGNLPRRLTPQGHETQVATNHLGPALLALLLHDGLAKAPDPRIVTTGTNVYSKLRVRFDLDDLDAERGYSRSAVYGRTKTLHMAWAVEHQHRLAAAGSPVRSVVAHPGMVTTPMNTALPRPSDRLLARALGVVWGARDPEQGERPLLFAATAPAADPDLFAGPVGDKEDSLVGFEAFRPPVSDAATRARVWDVTDRVLGHPGGLLAR